MSGHLATRAQQKELRQTFAQFDENGDGLIQHNEFIAAYRKLYPNQEQAEVDERANEIFTMADVDGSGGIDFGEWCTATINQNQLLNESNMRAAFALFDKDGGGTISAEEVAAILGHNVAKEEGVWEAVIREVDINGDGQIDFEEFQQMMLKLADGKIGDASGPAQK
jgi:calcium-dependent protein kinase